MMLDKFEDYNDQLKMLKDLQGKFNDVDMSDPEKMLDSLGINMDEMEDYFNSSMNQKLDLKVSLKYTNESENKEPEYAYESDSGFDLRSTEESWIQANSRSLISTGLKFDIPDGYEIQVRSKSGLALNQGLMVLNSPGTVDSGFLGEVKVIMFNTTNERIKIEKGQKIAQAVLCPVLSGKWVDLIKVGELEEKDRNDKGFGSTNLF
jgi:dUTP pyrophosphatase